MAFVKFFKLVVHQFLNLHLVLNEIAIFKKVQTFRQLKGIARRFTVLTYDAKGAHASFQRTSDPAFIRFVMVFVFTIFTMKIIIL